MRAGGWCVCRCQTLLRTIIDDCVVVLIGLSALDSGRSREAETLPRFALLRLAGFVRFEPSALRVFIGGLCGP